MGLTELREEIEERFDESEFKRFCFSFSEKHPELRFNYGDIPNQLNLRDKVQETLRLLERRGERAQGIKKFVAFLQKERPEGNFEAALNIGLEPEKVDELIAAYRQNVVEDNQYLQLPHHIYELGSQNELREMRIAITAGIQLQAIDNQAVRRQEEARAKEIEEKLKKEASSVPAAAHQPEPEPNPNEQTPPPAAVPPPVPVEAQKAAAEHHKLIIWGKSGMGKSTFLRYLAHQEARKPDGYIPIVVPLKAFKDLPTPENGFIQTYVFNQISQKEGELARALRQKEGEQKIWWLLDGLDEAQQMAQKIVEEAQRLPGKVTITSRPGGNLNLSGFEQFDLQKITLRDVEQFVTLWFNHLPLKNAPQAPQELLTNLRKHPVLSKFIDNPLLLVMLLSIQVNYRAGEVEIEEITQEVDLYEQYIEKIIQNERETRPLAWATAGSDSQKEVLTRLLKVSFGGLGWVLHIASADKNHEPTKTNIQRKLTTYLAGQPGLEEYGQDRDIGQKVFEFWQRTGLLRSLEINKQSYFIFYHQNFQEYAVACFLHQAWQKDRNQTWQLLAPQHKKYPYATRLHHPTWQEPLRLLAQKMSGEELENLITRLWQHPSPDEKYLHRDLFLITTLLKEGREKLTLQSEIIKQLGQLPHNYRHKIYLNSMVLVVNLIESTLLIFSLLVIFQILPLWLFGMWLANLSFSLYFHPRYWWGGKITNLFAYFLSLCFREVFRWFNFGKYQEDPFISDSWTNDRENFSYNFLYALVLPALIASIINLQIPNMYNIWVVSLFLTPYLFIWFNYKWVDFHRSIINKFTQRVFFKSLQFYDTQHSPIFAKTLSGLSNLGEDASGEILALEKIATATEFSYESSHFVNKENAQNWIRALAAVGSSKAVNLLIEYWKKDTSPISEWAYEALISMNNEEVFTSIIKIWLNEKGFPFYGGDEVHDILQKSSRGSSLEKNLANLLLENSTLSERNLLSILFSNKAEYHIQLLIGFVLCDSEYPYDVQPQIKVKLQNSQDKLATLKELINEKITNTKKYYPFKEVIFTILTKLTNYYSGSGFLSDIEKYIIAEEAEKDFQQIKNTLTFIPYLATQIEKYAGSIPNFIFVILWELPEEHRRYIDFKLKELGKMVGVLLWLKPYVKPELINHLRHLETQEDYKQVKLLISYIRLCWGDIEAFHDIWKPMFRWEFIRYKETEDVLIAFGIEIAPHLISKYYCIMAICNHFRPGSYSYGKEFLKLLNQKDTQLLSEIKNEWYSPSLSKCLEIIENSLIRIGGEQVIEFLKGRAKSKDKIGINLYKFNNEEVLQFLIEETEQTQNYVTATALGKLGDIRAIPILINNLTAGHVEIIELLGQLKDSRAIEGLLRLLSKKYYDFSTNIAYVNALCEIGYANEKDKPIIIEAFINQLDKWSYDEPQRRVKGSIVEALGKLKAQKALPYLIEIIEKLDFKEWDSSQFAIHIITAFGEIGDPSVVPILWKTLDFWETGVNSASATALRKIGQKALPYLVEEFQFKPDKGFIYWLGVLSNKGNKEVIKLLQGHLASSDYVIEALAKIGDESVFAYFVELLPYNKNEKLQKAIGEMAGSVTDIKLLEQARKLLLKHRPNTPPEISWTVYEQVVARLTVLQLDKLIHKEPLSLPRPFSF